MSRSKQKLGWIAPSPPRPVCRTAACLRPPVAQVHRWRGNRSNHPKLHLPLGSFAPSRQVFYYALRRESLGDFQLRRQLRGIWKPCHGEFSRRESLERDDRRVGYHRLFRREVWHLRLEERYRLLLGKFVGQRTTFLAADDLRR